MSPSAVPQNRGSVIAIGAMFVNCCSSDPRIESYKLVDVYTTLMPVTLVHDRCSSRRHVRC